MESNDEKESIGLITLADSQSKAYVKELYKSYELYLKPLEEVRKIFVHIVITMAWHRLG